MMRVLAFCAVAMFVMPALGQPISPGSAAFKATIDGSFNIYHSSSGNEGYGNAGNSGSFRLNKTHQHLGYMDWAGQEDDMAAWIAAHPTWEAYVWVRSAAETNNLKNQAGIVTIRTSNVGDIVEDAGLSAASYNSDLESYNVAGSSGSVAFRMADYELTSPGRYANDFSGIDKFGYGTFAGEPWKTPSTRNTTVRSGMWGTPGPNAPIQRKPGVVNLGYDGDTLWAVEGVVGFDWSQGNNTVSRFEQAGQLVNKNDDGSFRLFDPATCYVADGWYKVKLNNAIVLDIINNWENKGIVFSNWVAGASTQYGNENVYSSEQAGGAWAPAIELTPEPATLALVALGGLALIRRRR